MNDTALITQETAVVAFNTNKLDEILKEIEKDALNLVADVETGPGRKQIISKAASVASKKVIIDKAGKELNEERKRLTDIVNADRKRSRNFLDNLRDIVRQPVTDYEEKEKIRIQAERIAVELEMAQEEAIAENDLFDRLQEVNRKEAELKAQEDERLEKERVEQAKKEKIVREAKIATDAKEKAEKDAADAIEEANRLKIQAEEKAKLDAAQAEQDQKDAVAKARQDEQKRQAEMERKKDEEEQKAAEKANKKAQNVDHQRKTNREALEDLKKSGIEEEGGKLLITLIAQMKIRHIRIDY